MYVFYLEVFSFSTLNILCNSFLACTVSTENLLIILWDSLVHNNMSSLAAFRILSLNVYISIVIRLDVDAFCIL